MTLTLAAASSMASGSPSRRSHSRAIVASRVGAGQKIRLALPGPLHHPVGVLRPERIDASDRLFIDLERLPVRGQYPHPGT